MEWLKQSLVVKIFSLFIVGLTLIFAVSEWGFLRFSHTVDQHQTLLNQEFNNALTITQINLEFKRQVQEWKNVLIRGNDANQLNKYWGRFEAQEKKIKTMLEALQQNVKDKETLNTLENFRTKYQEMATKYRQGKDTFVQSKFDISKGDKSVSGVDREPSKLLEEAAARLSTIAAEEAATAKADSNKVSLVATSSMIVILVIVGVALSLMLHHFLVKPTRQIIDHISNVSEGELTTVLQLDREDELGKLASAANQLQLSLKTTVTNLKDALSSLSFSSSELVQISSGINKGIQEQHSRTDQVATAMNQMTATANEVAEHAQGAASAASQADESAQESMTVMEGTIKTIENMSQEIANASEVIQKLEEDTKSIGTVLDVIRGIAEQTNLLALNAAIEAARAGDQGRGFAVVADEVRTLAQRTQQSTAEIQGIIENVQVGAHHAVEAIERGKTQTDLGVERVSQAGTALKNITQAVEEIRDMNHQIATAAEEQTSVAEDITQNIHEITTIASSNSDQAEKTAQTSAALEDLSNELEKIVNKLGH
ncbi:methyl-accepting chemotaxis protein [Spartinivicinus poritis]|uniref:HAMP domain-containing methyl-accepting chemotaxis protein n=1 Tax=Spartinivicinus poritis TaxID=2994640 RepID=A0ABT5U970_9GAMM|nr:HAMP domain-containing methyl-accepting chemotaxis protein [Spartinivicinus sp. A2-2]MDE1462842.1 HAMP domain-containing methyl-accepting chemotaxis protein [Spartinivicinus sp. A2-2]